MTAKNKKTPPSELPAATPTPHLVSTGWKMKDLSQEQLQAAPDDVFEIYFQMKAGQAVDPTQLARAIQQHGGKYFIGPKARYKKAPKKAGFSDKFKAITRLKSS